MSNKELEGKLKDGSALMQFPTPDGKEVGDVVQVEYALEVFQAYIDKNYTPKNREDRCVHDESRGLLISSPPQCLCENCGQTWVYGDTPPVCKSKVDDKDLDEIIQNSFRGFAARRHKSERDTLDDYNLCVANAKQAILNWHSSQVEQKVIEGRIDNEQINKMVDRFLGWELPDTFSPDGGITYAKNPNPTHRACGTNLFTADEAEGMIRHILAQLKNTEGGEDE